MIERAAGDERQEQAGDRQVEGKRREEREGEAIAADVLARRPLEIVGQPAMIDEDALRRAGRSGRVDDVRRDRRAAAAARAALWTCRCRSNSSRRMMAAPGLAIAADGVVADDHVPGAAILEDVAEPRCGKLAIERHISAPALSTARIAITASIDRSSGRRPVAGLHAHTARARRQPPRRR